MINFNLPKELIAQEPANPRDSARLLVYDRTTKIITDTVFSELPRFLKNDTTLVVNNSKVEKCRWLFDEGKTEIFVLEKLDSHTVRALVRPGKKFKLGQETELNDWLSVETTAIDDEGIRTIKLNVQHDDARLKKIEHIPLPPYIAQNDELADEYQTIYAKLSKSGGSKAAPTAGLHFTPELMDKIKTNNDVLEVTLHVGLGTFASLTEENLKQGKLHSESYEIIADVAEKLKKANHITAVGTTTVRTLESCSIFSTTVNNIGQNLDKKGGMISGDTDILIQPGYIFRAVDSMVTNFHLPGTSLLLMVEAFVGSTGELQRIYDYAIAEKYRFYSFGDAMLIL
jgi:S-adenosylmethionine:tRNA ribosyltransferase-isomerase